MRDRRIRVSVLQEELPESANLGQHRGSQGSACGMYGRLWVLAPNGCRKIGLEQVRVYHPSWDQQLTIQNSPFK